MNKTLNGLILFSAEFIIINFVDNSITNFIIYVKIYFTTEKNISLS